VGVALAAAKRHPDGFPRYRHKRSYSAAVNKFMRENDLLPDGVTIGGTRHTWESRLKAVGVMTDDRGEIMGHSVKEARGREVYGDEMALKMRKEVVDRIALPVPDHLA
ncbi:MAG: integrase, partial [Loktanella sp.]|nr:integrase [Loktanella sp.]